MRLGVFAKTFAGTDPAGVLTSVAAAGFSATQYNLACSGLPSMPNAIPGDAAAAVAAAAAAVGVTVDAVSGTYNMIHPDRAVRAAGHARLAILAGACRGMSTRCITLCTGTRDAADQWRHHPDNASPEAWRDLLASMEHAIAVADAYDVDLAIEPELANVVSSAAKARRLIDELASRRVKVVLDAANLFEIETLARQRATVAAAADLLADCLVMAHAKDRTASGAFTTAGDGVLDYPHYVACLKAVGFDGPLIAHGLAAAAAPGVATFLRRVLDAAGIAAVP